MHYNKNAYNQGREAAERGWERISPYHGVVAETYWYAGYDNTKVTNFSTYHRNERRDFATDTCGPLVLYRSGLFLDKEETDKISGL